jgi:hypothetical protein
MEGVRLLSDHTVFIHAEEHEQIAITIAKGTLGFKKEGLGGLQGHHYTFALTDNVSITIPVYNHIRAPSLLGS